MTQSEFNVMLENALDFYNSRHSGSQIDQGVTGGLGAVRFDTAQTLAEMQKAQARSNLGIRADGATGAVDSVNGKTGTVVLNGDDIYANSQNTETIGEALGNIHYVNPNLLDNWYFGNPVNQRGQSSYSGSGYTIDRWKNYNAASVMSVMDGFIRLSNDSESTVNLVSFLGDNFLKLGSTITLSILLNDGILFSNSGPVVSGASAQSSFGSGTIYYTGDNNWVVISTFAKKMTDIVAVKLELGSVQTLAHQDDSGNWVLNEIPDYGEQLARCQRYYYTSGGNIFVLAEIGGAGTVYANITTPVPMRTTPALSCTQTYLFTPSGSIDASQLIFTAYAVRGNNVMIRSSNAISNSGVYSRNALLEIVPIVSADL